METNTYLDLAADSAPNKEAKAEVAGAAGAGGGFTSTGLGVGIGAGAGLNPTPGVKTGAVGFGLNTNSFALGFILLSTFAVLLTIFRISYDEVMNIKL